MASSVEPAQAGLPSRICVSIGHNDPEMFQELACTEAERGELLFEFCLELALPKIVKEPAEEAVHNQAGWMTRVIAAVTLSNPASSAASCLRPFGVKE